MPKNIIFGLRKLFYNMYKQFVSQDIILCQIKWYSSEKYVVTFYKKYLWAQNNGFRGANLKVKYKRRPYVSGENYLWLGGTLWHNYYYYNSSVHIFATVFIIIHSQHEVCFLHYSSYYIILSQLFVIDIQYQGYLPNCYEFQESWQNINICRIRASA